MHRNNPNGRGAMATKLPSPSLGYYEQGRKIQVLVLEVMLNGALLLLVGFFFLIQQARCFFGPNCPDNERAALLAIASADSSGYLKKQFFILGLEEDCCISYDITCDPETGHVQSLFLGLEFASFKDNEIPRQVCDLVMLESLSLEGGRTWNGTIPSCVCTMPNLQKIALMSIATAEVVVPPSCISNLPRLSSLNIYQARAPIPLDKICTLMHLEELKISDSTFVSASLGCLPSLQKLHTLAITGTELAVGWPIPRDLCHLRNLSYLDMNHNSLTGSIPSCLGSLKRLTNLVLRGNNLTGNIPSSFIQLQELEHLDLSDNDLEGHIPAFDGQRLQSVDLSYNTLTGSLPTSFENLPSLKSLSMSSNNLGSMLPSFRNASTLELLDLSSNSLTGPFPQSLCNLSALSVLRLSSNFIRSELPCGSSSGHISVLELQSNRMFGQLDPGLLNSSDLTFINLSGNGFTGPMPTHAPEEDHSVPASIDFSNNRLTGTLSDVGWSCGTLLFLDLSNNSFSGSLPSMLDNCSSLSVCSLRANHFEGRIPWKFGGWKSLSELSLADNRLTGELPEGLGNCTNLGLLDLSGNHFTGKLGPWVSNLTLLQLLILRSNSLEGPIPDGIGNSSYLIGIDISDNQFSGGIANNIDMPGWRGNSNSFLRDTFRIPSRAGVFVFLKGELRRFSGIFMSMCFLDLSNNLFQGEIPESFGNFSLVHHLKLSSNRFGGRIPESLGNLHLLESLELSNNHLSGPIPQTLTQLTKLAYFNVSYNDLSGDVPQGGQLSTFTNTSYIGNPRLCLAATCPSQPAAPAQSLAGPGQGDKRSIMQHRIRLYAILISCCAITTLLMVALGSYCSRHADSKERAAVVHQDSSPVVSTVSESELWTATQGYNAANIIGHGGCSIVYKGTLRCGRAVAVKVLKLQRSADIQNLTRECATLRQVRHRNLVRIRGCCLEPEFKALVFELMPNGTLDKHLHDDVPAGCQLSWNTRLNIAVGIAQALCYLHCEFDVAEAIVHCDLKPSNIFLDDCMEAHVGDFGSSRRLCLANKGDDSLSRFRGSIGYIPPEFALTGRISTKGDVYSYGIVILEMLTRRRPTSSMFKDGDTLPGWVRSTYPDVGSLLDPVLYNELDSSSVPSHQQNVTDLLRIGIMCTNQSPEDRPTMLDVTRMLAKMRKDSECVCSSLPWSTVAAETDMMKLYDPCSTEASGIAFKKHVQTNQ